ncbi:hypothetical protein C8Q79DRAFT_669125 [Trametes meyenii]|nr:hypothetical protein C8Q79DRAFT_669125 [Trametes meyenii]
MRVQTSATLTTCAGRGRGRRQERRETLVRNLSPTERRRLPPRQVCAYHGPPIQRNQRIGCSTTACCSLRPDAQAASLQLSAQTMPKGSRAARRRPSRLPCAGGFPDGTAAPGDSSPAWERAGPFEREGTLNGPDLPWKKRARSSESVLRNLVGAQAGFRGCRPRLDRGARRRGRWHRAREPRRSSAASGGLALRSFKVWPIPRQ